MLSTCTEPKSKEPKSNKIKSFKYKEQTGGYRPERDERGEKQMREITRCKIPDAKEMIHKYEVYVWKYSR